MGLGTSRINLLLIFANPRNTDALRLATEDRTILQSLRLSHYGNRFSVTRCHAATIHDIRRALLDEEMHIVHIASHGVEAGLVLEDEAGGEYIVPPDALAELLGAHSPPLECILLNACFSVAQAELLSPLIPYVIHMDGPISDDAAIEFSKGFYEALGAGKDVKFAYEDGLHAVALAQLQASFTARLLRRRLPADEVASGGGLNQLSDLPIFIQGLDQQLRTTKQGAIAGYEYDEHQIVFKIVTDRLCHIVRISVSEFCEKPQSELADMIVRTCR